MIDSLLRSGIISWADLPEGTLHTKTTEGESGSFSESGVTVAWTTRTLRQTAHEITLTVEGDGETERGIRLRFDLPLPRMPRLEWWESVNRRLEPTTDTL